MVASSIFVGAAGAATQAADAAHDNTKAVTDKKRMQFPFVNWY